MFTISIKSPRTFLDEILTVKTILYKVVDITTELACAAFSFLLIFTFDHHVFGNTIHLETHNWTQIPNSCKRHSLFMYSNSYEQKCRKWPFTIFLPIFVARRNPMWMGICNSPPNSTTNKVPECQCGFDVIVVILANRIEQGQIFSFLLHKTVDYNLSNSFNVL